jgi:hypothetical protein
VLLAVLLSAQGNDETARIDKLAQSNAIAGETLCMLSPLRTFYTRSRDAVLTTRGESAPSPLAGYATACFQI